MQVPWLESLSRARFASRSPAAKVLIAFAALLVLQALAVVLSLREHPTPDAPDANADSGAAAALDRIASAAQALDRIASAAAALDKIASAAAALDAEPLQVQRTLPTTRLEREDGSLLDREMLRGKPLLLWFWDSRCEAEGPQLTSLLAQTERHPEWQVLVVATDHDWERVRAGFHGAIPPQVVRDLDGAWARTLAIGSLPDSYLIDRHGVARFRLAGGRDWQSPAAQQLLALAAE